MRKSLAAMLVLSACTTRTVAPSPAEVTERATAVGRQVRAAQACNVNLPTNALDRAARLEASAIALKLRGVENAHRDAFLASLLPPRQRGRDRAAWCRTQGPDIERARQWLTGPDADAFVRSAEMLASSEAF
jgi:hypothetical protein